jgi:FkbM family methyltransferase
MWSFSTFKSYLKRIHKLIDPRLIKIDFAPSFSQEGEDMILRRIFDQQRIGFYVDIGAHDPIRFSNTYYFYLNGWRGLNIDAMPGSMDRFNKIRPRDMNIEAAVSDSKTQITYYGFNDPALNGFSKEISLNRNKLINYRIIFEKEIQTTLLSELLDLHLPINQKIDFLNIDVEGLDFNVLCSNNWDKYRPKVILVEDLSLESLEGIGDSKIHSLLKTYGYQLHAKTMNTLIFMLMAEQENGFIFSP